jgi:hypothetical protein
MKDLIIPNMFVSYPGNVKKLKMAQGDIAAPGPVHFLRFTQIICN